MKTTARMSTPALDTVSHREILADWFARLAEEAGLGLSQRGTSAGAFTIGPADDFHVRAEFVDDPPYLVFVGSDDAHDDLIAELGAEAAARVEAGDWGGTVWYSARLQEEAFTIASAQFMGTLLARLGNQTRIVGWRRLGRNVLLEFTEEGDATEESRGTPTLLAPRAMVDVHMAVPGPCAGHFASKIAHRGLEIVGAICTFALGRPVVLPPVVFPTKIENRQNLENRKTYEAILTLARKGASLDVFAWLGLPGGEGIFERLRSALLTYDAAVKQDHDEVAAILYVVAAECLTTPNAPWRTHRLTKRFQAFFEDLIPEVLDEIVAHGNFEEALGIRRSGRTDTALRKRALDRIYGFRSGRLHEGLDPVYKGVGTDPGMHARRGLLGDFAEGAILAFGAAPRSSLIGHPAFAPNGDDCI